MLGTDSTEYEILQRAVLATANMPLDLMTCEIGLREGGGTKVILDALVASKQLGRTHIAIDPYGNIEYETEENVVTRFDYTNQMRNRCMRELFYYIQNYLDDQVNVLPFILEDTEFFARFADGVPVYTDSAKKILTNYSLVHFDGPHALGALNKEFMFFYQRSVDGSMFVFDDIGNYPHSEFEKEVLFSNGLTMVEKGHRKASYRVNK